MESVRHMTIRAGDVLQRPGVGSLGSGEFPRSPWRWGVCLVGRKWNELQKRCLK